MEKGNEGDEIIFLSLRHIECNIPEGIVKIGQIDADLLVEIIARSLLLITDGEAKFPFSLPQNIASRHRICTSIAAKIKELGFLSDCGYNQLLYPVESQTRDLLKWLVEKLPRTEEEGAQEVLGANALMNRRIMQSLKEWKQQPWKLQFCSKGKVLRNVYDNRQFRTIPGLLQKRGEDGKGIKTLEIFEKASECKMSVECSLFERHVLEHINDSKYAQRLEQDFADSQLAVETEEHEDGELGTGSSNETKQSDKRGSAKLTQQTINAALLKAVQGSSNGTSSSSSVIIGGLRNGADNIAESTTTAGEVSAENAALTRNLSTSFQDLLQNITENYKSTVGGQHGVHAGDRGTRFSHAMEFGQEATATAALAAMVAGKTDPSSSATGIIASSSGAGGGRSLSAASKNFESNVASDPSGAGAGAETEGKGGSGATRDSRARKLNQAELEELARQEELDALRAQVQQYATTVETIVRNQQTAASRTKQFEADLESLMEETENREKEVLLKKRTLELLPSARDNIAKLQEQGSAGTQRMLELAQEWEHHRQPLVEAMMGKEDVLNTRREKGRLMVEEVKRYRTEMTGMIQDLREKQDRMQVLDEEQAKLNKSINRAMYTHRIMDITNQIVKQNRDIDKITADIRDLQKTINLSSATLQRADAITEELIFAAANDKNDPVMVDTYRRLKTLRAKFEELIDTVSRIGQQEKALRDLETRIDQEKSRISSNNFDRILSDLNAITQENHDLVHQIKTTATSAGAGVGKHK